MKKKKRIWLYSLIAIILLVAGYIGYVFCTYYRLPDKLTLEVEQNGEHSYFKDEFKVSTGTYYTAMTYNIGFGAYREDFSFFMDGGKYSQAKDKETVIAGVCEMAELTRLMGADFIMMQEVDIDGTRSHHVNELELINQFIKGYYYVFAQNYDSPFLFFPPWEPHGANTSGLVTFSRANVTDTMRRSLPISESLSKFVDLDRCYSIVRIPVENGKELCLYNVHLTAYGGNDEVRKGQLSMLYNDMETDYKAGNYVICGGDFNHNLKEEEDENAPEWAYPFPRETLPEGFRMAVDEAKEAAYVDHNTCRSAQTPYEEGTTYTVTLDGFIVSDNVTVNYYLNADWGYRFSDHDPVMMQFLLK